METNQLIKAPVAFAWVTLVIATCISWWLGVGHGPQTFAAVAVIAVAFLKVYLVGAHFMDLRAAPALLRTAFNAWILLTSGALIGIYLMA